MENEKIEIIKETIKEVFKDTRELEYVPQMLLSDMDIMGDLFVTHDGEIVYLDFQKEDFGAEELADYAEIAEELYEKHHTKISIYVICPSNINVLVNECQIKSDANFSIKLACIGEDPIEAFLNEIRNKKKNGESLTAEDLKNLENLPMMGPKENRKKMRVECFRLLNEM